MAVGSSFLCSPNCTKQPGASYPFYKFIYPTISGRISKQNLLSVRNVDFFQRNVSDSCMSLIVDCKITRHSFCLTKNLTNFVPSKEKLYNQNCQHKSLSLNCSIFKYDYCSVCTAITHYNVFLQLSMYSQPPNLK